jgi:hypothetical protein
MHISDDATTTNALRRAALFAALQAIRSETFRARCRLDSPRNEACRELLASRLDATTARGADVFARMIESRAA